MTVRQTHRGTGRRANNAVMGRAAGSVMIISQEADEIDEIARRD